MWKNPSSAPVNLHQLLEGSELVTPTLAPRDQGLVWSGGLDFLGQREEKEFFKRIIQEVLKKLQSFRIKFLATNASILKSPPFNTHNALICIATCVEENCTSDFLATKQRVKRLSSCSKVDVGQTTQAESHTANTLPDAAGRGLCLILIFGVWFCDPSATWEPVTGKLKMDSTFKVWNPTAWCPKHQVSGEMDPLTMPHDQPGYTPNPVNITVRPDQRSGATPCYQSKSCYTPKVIGVISPTCCWYFSLVMVVPFHPTIYDVTDGSYIPSWFIEFPLATIWETLQVGWMLLEFDFVLPKFRGEKKWKWLSYPNHPLHHLLRFRGCRCGLYHRHLNHHFHHGICGTTEFGHQSRVSPR